MNLATRELIGALAGTALLTLGMTGLHPLNSYQPGVYKVVSAGLGAGGLALIIIATLRAGDTNASRLAIAAVYFGAAMALAGSAAILITNRIAGKVLVDLGRGLPKWGGVVLLIAGSVGLFGDGMQMNGLLPPAAFLRLVGQALYFSAFVVWGLTGLRTSCRFAELGVTSPWMFLPWKNCFSYSWGSEEELELAVRRIFLGPAKFKIHVPWNCRQAAEEILAAKVQKKH